MQDLLRLVGSKDPNETLCDCHNDLTVASESYGKNGSDIVNFHGTHQYVETSDPVWLHPKGDLPFEQFNGVITTAGLPLSDG